MCGISGRLYFDGRPVLREQIERMNDVLVHRGPDDHGIWIDGPIGLGNRRLAVLDPSPSGHMPMMNASETVVMTFNGEIYNYPELRRQLESRGYRFRSRTDTEAVLHLYDLHGTKCVEYLRGMFAIALWDRRRRRLFLARDRLGQKPLHYVATPKAVIFASEIKALLQEPDVRRVPDWSALHQYLTLGYVPEPVTAFLGIRRVPPAHLLTWDAGQLRIERYWSLQFESRPRRLKAAEEELIALLDEATRLRKLSDVPLGILLSGGVDSAAVLAMMSRSGSESPRTFTIGFGEVSFDETRQARGTAAACGSVHQEEVVNPDSVQDLPKIIWHVDEPLADTSLVPSYYLARFARQHVTVALNGDGGDEALGGYERYAAHCLAGRVRQVLGPVANWLASLAGSIPEGTDLRSPASRTRRFLGGVGFGEFDRYAAWMSVFSTPFLDRLYSPDVRRQTPLDGLGALRSADDRRRHLCGLNRLLAVDYETYLPSDLLVKSDRMTMAHSLEARSPFLDHRLVEFAATLPPEWKVRGMTGKWLYPSFPKGVST